MSFARFMNQVYFRTSDRVDARHGHASTEHAASSYGVAVVVSDGVAYGPSDIAGGKVQAFGSVAKSLQAAGFEVVENI